MKLQKNDKIKWDLEIGGETIYTVLDIDRTRPIRTIKSNSTLNPIHVKNEILLGWENNGEFLTAWDYDYDEINKAIERGIIKIVERHEVGTPVRNIKKLKI